MRYAVQPENPAKVAKSSGSYLRVHFKNTRETVHAIRQMPLDKAIAYLEAVKDHKRAIPFTRYAGGTGRTGQVKEFGFTRGRWPVKSVEFVLGLLKNAESNAEAKGLDLESLYIKHVQANQAPRQRRRTYRAHGRINPYMSSPTHLELILGEKAEVVPKAEGAAAPARTTASAIKLSRRSAAIRRNQK